MRILMLAQFYPPVIGGEETHVRNLSLALHERGHQVTVLTLSHEDLPAQEMDKGVQVMRVRATAQRGGGAIYQTARRHAPPFPDPEVMLMLRRIVREQQPEIVHGHNWLLHSYIPLKSRGQAKFVVSLHDYSLCCANKKLMYMEHEQCSGPGFTKCLHCVPTHYGLKGIPITLMNWTMQPLERATVDMFLPVSQAVAEGNGLIKRNLPYRVMPNFVPDDTGEREYNDQGCAALLPKEPFILFVGDLNAAKGADIAIQAYSQLQNAPPLVLIGREFPETPKELPPNVHLFKSWPHEAVMEAWRRSLIALVPSRWAEPFGIVAIEALASGKPVIASRTGGLPDIVTDGETGLLFKPGDAADLKKAVALLLADPAMREQMGQAARRRAVNFHVSTVVPQFEQVYGELLNGSKPKQTSYVSLANRLTDNDG